MWARIRLIAVAAIGALSLLFCAVGIAFWVDRSRVAGNLLWLVVAILPVYAVAIWLVRRRPDHVQARRLLLVSSFLALGTAIERLVQIRPELVETPDRLLWTSMVHQIASAVATAPVVLLLATYPDGAVERRWQRVLGKAVWFIVAVPLLRVVTSPQVPVGVYLVDVRPDVENPWAIAALAWADPVLHALTDGYAVGLVGAVALLIRYRQAAAQQRARMRLLVYSFAVGGPLLLVAYSLRLAGLPDDSSMVTVVEGLTVPLLLMLPVSIVVGVMKYGLYEIDVIVRRSLVYAVLSFGIAVLYIGLAVLPGIALGDTVPVPVAVVVTIAAALLFQPLRRRLDRVADRWVFGAKVNRYQLLTDFGADLDRTVDIGELLPRLAGTVQQGLKAPWVRVSLPNQTVVAGEPAGEVALSVPLERGTEQLGGIECGAKAGGYDATDRELLGTLAGQAATAIANVRLSDELAERLDELERSRARIVAAQDAERRRIERDIHDGVQQQVVALMMNLRLARNQVTRGDRSAESAFGELQGEVKDLLVDLRELAHGIHPPVLSDGGLIAAVEARTARLPFNVRLSSTELRGTRFDADIEGAAYFVISEALTNVAKHARATDTEVAVWTTDGHLSVQIRDDGRGFVPGSRSGSGLTNLRDRVEALGGRLSVTAAPGAGTTVLAELPQVDGGGHG